MNIEQRFHANWRFALAAALSASAFFACTSDTIDGFGSGAGPSGSECGDGDKNGKETDVDCGGATCDPCASGKACAAASDCASNVCTNGSCVGGAQDCTNVAKDGYETDVDCGGGTCPPCDNGKACINDADCTSGTCIDKVWQFPAAPMPRQRKERLRD